MAQLIKAPAARSRPLVTESEREGVERRNHRFLVCLFAVLFGLVVLKTAWMSDDAYFSVRAGYNLMHGHGLTSNADERVHGFTNPGWTVLLGVVCWVSRDYYLGPLALGVLVTGLRSSFCASD